MRRRPNHDELIGQREASVHLSLASRFAALIKAYLVSLNSSLLVHMVCFFPLVGLVLV
jgi:hypothetical protein